MKTENQIKNYELLGVSNYIQFDHNKIAQIIKEKVVNLQEQIDKITFDFYTSTGFPLWLNFNSIKHKINNNQNLKKEVINYIKKKTSFKFREDFYFNNKHIEDFIYIIWNNICFQNKELSTDNFKNYVFLKSKFKEKLQKFNIKFDELENIIHQTWLSTIRNENLKSKLDFYLPRETFGKYTKEIISKLENFFDISIKVKIDECKPRYILFNLIELSEQIPDEIKWDKLKKITKRAWVEVMKNHEEPITKEFNIPTGKFKEYKKEIITIVNNEINKYTQCYGKF